MYRVTDLQACNPEGLPTTDADADGCYVTLSTEVDAMGFPSADVYAPTKGKLVAFLADNWGSDDWEWIAATVARIEEAPAPLSAVPTVEMISDALRDAMEHIEEAQGWLRAMWDRAWEDRRHSDYNELTVSLAMLDHASEILLREITG